MDVKPFRTASNFKRLQNEHVKKHQYLRRRGKKRQCPATYLLGWFQVPRRSQANCRRLGCPLMMHGDPRAWSDEMLIDAMIAGHPQAGDVLYTRLVRVVEWSICRVLGQRSNEREDLVQAAFEQIVTTLYRNTFARGCSLTSWASALSSRLALTELRTQRRRLRNLGQPVELEDVSLASREGDVETQASTREALSRVRQALAEIHPDHAEILVLRELNELELPEIAEVLNLSMTATYSRLSRGKKELADRLAHLNKELP
jgi:RNA polymerase sigma-70 factor, ECF subfamily